MEIYAKRNDNKTIKSGYGPTMQPYAIGIKTLSLHDFANTLLVSRKSKSNYPQTITP
jgi:hypothetical protein